MMHTLACFKYEHVRVASGSSITYTLWVPKHARKLSEMSIFYTNEGNNISDGNSVNSQKSTWKTLSSKKNVSKEKNWKKFITIYFSRYLSDASNYYTKYIKQFLEKNDCMSRKSEYLYIA